MGSWPYVVCSVCAAFSCNAGSSWMIFQEAHYNPVTGRMGCDRPLEQLMPWFYWLGFQAGHAPNLLARALWSVFFIFTWLVVKVSLAKEQADLRQFLILATHSCPNTGSAGLNPNDSCTASCTAHDRNGMSSFHFLPLSRQFSWSMDFNVCWNLSSARWLSGTWRLYKRDR